MQPSPQNIENPVTNKRSLEDLITAHTESCEEQDDYGTHTKYLRVENKKVACSGVNVTMRSQSSGFLLDGNVSVPTALQVLQEGPVTYQTKLKSPMVHGFGNQVFDICVLKSLCSNKTYVFYKFGFEGRELQWVLRGDFINDKAKQIFKDKVRKGLSRNPMQISRGTLQAETDLNTPITLENQLCPVDEFCPIRDQVTIFQTAPEIFEAKFSGTVIERNCNNFFIIQLLQSKTDKNKFYLFYHYGRQGCPGNWVLRGTYTKDEALAIYYNKVSYTDKKFYKRVGMTYTQNDDDIIKKASHKQINDSMLQKELAKLIQLLFKGEEVFDPTERILLDYNELPMGKLSLKTINEALGVTQQLKAALDNNASQDQLRSLSSIFCSLFPQNIGWRNAACFIINDIATLETFTNLLQNLKRCVHADQTVYGPTSTNPLDQKYALLRCQLEVVDNESEEYQLLVQYFTNSLNKEIIQIFKITTDKPFNTNELNNIMLLWHGTRLANIPSILSQGLKIAPEGVTNGNRLQSGIYMADMSEKSFQYCYPEESDGYSCLLLCEAALGSVEQVQCEDDVVRPEWDDSVKGLGRIGPNEDGDVNYKGVTIPLGEPVRTQYQTSQFKHNEYVMYDEIQTRNKYLVLIKGE